MNTLSAEWLEFLRKQFPEGSQIKIKETVGPHPPIAPDELGKLEQIDDGGRFHVRMGDGASLVLVLGEDRFSVRPAVPTTLKLYMPLTADLYTRDRYGDLENESTPLDGADLRAYEGAIYSALVKNRVPEEAGRGLMLWCDKEFLDVKVRSAVFTAEARGGRLWGVAECQVVGQLSPEELTSLKDYLTGQAADGVGEGLEQQAIRVDGGELYVHLWQPEGWSIQTEAEQFGLTQIQEPPDDVVPTEAQHNRFGGERSSGEMSEPCPQGEAKGMERGMTMGGMSL